MKRFLFFGSLAALFVISLTCGCTGCGSATQTTDNPPQHIKGNVSRVFMHDPGTYNSGSLDYRFIPGYYSVFEIHQPSKQVLWHNFCDTNAKVIIDVEKGAPCWFEADIRTDERRRGAYTNVVIHLWSDKQIERGGSGGGKFSQNPDD
jgi:hypothetical protein